MNKIASLHNHWSRIICKVRFFLNIPDVAPKQALDFPFSRSDIAMFYRVTRDEVVKHIDEHTASDMLLDVYADQVTAGSSIFAQQIMHKRLRQGAQDEQGKQRLQRLMADTALLDTLRQCCLPLREVETEVSEQLFTNAIPGPAAWYKFMWLLPVSISLLFIVAMTTLASAWIAVLAIWLILLGVQTRFHDAVTQWAKKVQALQALLSSFVLLAEHHPMDANSSPEDLLIAKKMLAELSRHNLVVLPGMREYADWFLLDNVRHFFKTCILVRKNQDFLCRAYSHVANLEADLALVRHCQSLLQYCWATVADKKQLCLQQVVHPLLPQATGLDITLEGKGAFISGQNGIGKSTLLRTLGLNLIVARAFGFCYAATASVPVGAVFSSMQSEDSLIANESLYQAELRRAKELLDIAESDTQAVFVIDEIFRGTNHQESISAAAAVLQSLAASNMVVVSSHNLVLAPILAAYLAPLCVTAELGDKSRLQLTAGVLADPNGIRLLGSYGFGDDIKNKASRVFDWLSDYLKHPDKCEQILENRSMS
ncbi:DNA mismatch repair protein MutS [Undibacterium sp.]|uniref:MutS-related protein n=1 Tax=Undibacterium sp. TaxID=1914977 RepID=UPI0027308F38|nr:DNA mismatch repair protein MutS [Undibacterium sp.]MDP1980612.1 DNA mismatch repair protein MutS [Undibacterium sp.]